MKNNLKKLLVLLLAANMFAGATLPTFAEEVLPENGTEVVENEDGTKKEITTTVTEETDEEGNTTITVKIEETIDETTGNVTDDGVTVDYEQTTITTTTTNEEGEEIGSSKVVDGSETKSWTEEDSGDEEGQPEVEVELELIPGKKTEATAKETTVTGDEENGTVTTVIDRTVTAEVTDIEITVNDSNTGKIDGNGTQLTPVAPTYDTFNNQVEDKVGVNDYLFDSLIFTQDPSKWILEEGAEYRFVGYGEDCKYSIATVEVYYEKDENGNTLYDSDGKPIIKDIRTVSGTNVTINGEDAFSLEGGHQLSPYNGTVPATLQFMDKNGNKVYAYCCDEDTSTVGGAWYTVANLEDSDYYASEEAEKHIRAIALNGYWGSSDIPKSDGSYETGSLEKIKQDLKNAIAAGNLDAMYEMNCFTAEGKLLYGEDGQPVTKMVNMLDYIDGLTAGEALSATQAAIWSYSNGHQNALNGVDGTVIVAPDYRGNHKPTQSDKLDDFGGARISFLYDWLMNLETENKNTTVINEKNFLEDVSLVVGDQVADHADNQDTNEDNNVYNTSMNFTLAFSVGENDELIVYLMDEHGSVMKDKDGNDIIKHLAPKGADAADGYICPAADGSYTLTGLQLSENEDFKFDLRLEGTQYLEQGVYLYQPIGGRTTSQTAVGVAEGTREVDVSCAMTIKFDVDEDNHVVAERHWHEEIDPEIDPEDPTPDPEPKDPKPEPKDEDPKEDPKPEDPKEDPKDEDPKEDPKPEETPKRKFSFKLKVEEEPEIVEIPEEEIPLVNIPDEEIPLTNIPDEPVPMTGDSMFWYISSAAAVLGLCVLNLFGKKKNHNA